MSEIGDQDLTELRIEKRRQRQGKDAAQHAKTLSSLFAEHDSFRSAAKVAGYVAFDGEADPAPILAQLAISKQRCYLPVLDDSNALVFRYWTPQTPMQRNRFDIPEPAPESPTVEAQKLDLVLAPLVAFDDGGTRLGMGGGYYDRTFAFCLSNPEAAPLLVGLAYNCQHVSSLPRREWDVPLDAVLTEAGLTVFNHQRMEKICQSWPSNTG